MKRYCYVMVSTDGWDYWARIIGSSVEGMESSDWDKEKLADLMQQGWRPVRESAMGGGSPYSYSIILLEQE